MHVLSKNGPEKAAASNVVAKATCLDQLQQSVQVLNSIDTAAHLYSSRYFGDLSFTWSHFALQAAKASKPHMALTA